MRHFISLFVCFWSFSLCAEQSVVMGVILIEPFIKLNEKTNTCEGEALDITKSILAASEIQVEVVCANPSRIYKMIENAQVDFTINVTTTKAIVDHVEFVKLPFRKLELNLYSRHVDPEHNTVAAIKGFDYNGFRQQLSSKGYEFIDMPSPISASRLFAMGKTSHLIFYSGPLNYYVSKQVIALDDSVAIKTLDTTTSHYGIAKGSVHKQKLLEAFQVHAEQYQYPYFIESTTHL